MGKLRSLKKFLYLVKIFISWAYLQASSKFFYFALYTGPESKKSQNVPDRSEKVKMRFFANLNLDPGDFTKVLYDILWVS